MHKNRTNLILILSILTALVSIATLLLFLHIIKNKNEHTSNVLSTLEDNIAKKENASNLEKNASDIEKTKNSINSYFVDPTSIDSFIGYLEGLGASTGSVIKVESFDPSPATSNTLVVNLSVQGKFSGVMDTVMLLENAPYQIHITKTYLDKGAQLGTTDANGKTKPSGAPIWQGDISFSVLLSS